MLPANWRRPPASLPMSAPRMCRKRPSASRNITPNTVGKLYQGGTKVVPSCQFCERAVKLLWHRWTSAQRRLFGVTSPQEKRRAMRVTRSRTARLLAAAGALSAPFAAINAPFAVAQPDLTCSNGEVALDDTCVPPEDMGTTSVALGLPRGTVNDGVPSLNQGGFIDQGGGFDHGGGIGGGRGGGGGGGGGHGR